MRVRVRVRVLVAASVRRPRHSDWLNLLRPKQTCTQIQAQFRLNFRSIHLVTFCVFSAAFRQQIFKKCPPLIPAAAQALLRCGV